MTKTRAILITILTPLFALLGVAPAEAVTYKWNTTKGVHGSSITVGYCAGGTTTLSKGETITKDVCKIRVPIETNLYVYVSGTGTELYDYYNCSGSAKWLIFNSSTDTSRTAMVHHYKDGFGCA